MKANIFLATLVLVAVTSFVVLVSAPGVLDTDGDGIPDNYNGTVDNCWNVSNSNQADADGDGFGDVCDICLNSVDIDSDGDGNADACETVVDPDSDDDGVDDALDLCNNTASGAQVNPEGCSISQLCETSVENHGSYVSCVAKTSKTFIVLVPSEHGLIVSEAAQSDIGMPNVQ